MYKFISWNVNGLRAVCGKGFADIFTELDADFFCLQETKLQEGQINLEFLGYRSYWNYADKKGYSGTAIFTKHDPVSVTYGIGIDEHDHEGRVITLEMSDFFLVCVYTPNAQDELKRLDYRMKWEDDFREYLKGLSERTNASGEKMGVIVCGDLNVAHREIDLKNPKGNRKNPGFTDEFLPRSDRHIFMVVIPFPGTSEERRLAYRLFRRHRKPPRPPGRRQDTY